MIAIALVLTVYIGYYFVSKPFLRRLSSRLARSDISLFESVTTAERQAIFQMILVVMLHLTVVVVLGLLFLPPAWVGKQATAWEIQAVAAILALFVGADEAAASGVLAEAFFSGLTKMDTWRASRGHSSALAQTLLEASADGWMKTIRLSTSGNAPIGYVLLILQLGCEEVMFRFIIPASLPGGQITAGLLFVLIQFSSFKRISGGTFAAIGASVMACVHGYLALHTGFLLPLVAAHAAMFLSSSRLNESR